ncbi:MAG: hypothetical protein ACRYFS_03805 [Janthinobacterium lividum]
MKEEILQYWKPEAEDQFAGDMMPFWDGRQYHLFYLLDRDHHAEQGGLGGHQWAHASTSDLVHWEHYPLALPIGEPGSIDQHGICTGSIFEHDGVFHAFYATRVQAADGSVSEVVCRAVSRDLIHFDKSADNPMFAPPPDYDQGSHRDPFVFQHPETGTFHMLVTASQGGRGVLAHYTSENLDDWHLQEPFLVGRDGHSPECPELFCWNDWWYLVYSHDAQLEYRISRSPLGPWQTARRETIESPTLRVPRTAAFGDGRRLAVGFLAWRQDSRDSGEYVYAGNVVFRELLQDADGTLSTKLVPEMMPPAGLPKVEKSVSVEAGSSVVTIGIADVPADCTLTFQIVPTAGTDEFGLLLRADAQMKTGYRLRFLPEEKRVTLQSWPDDAVPIAVVSGMEGLAQPIKVIICLKSSVIDVCLNDRHTLIERGFDYRGTTLGFFAANGAASLEGLTISPI